MEKIHIIISIIIIIIIIIIDDDDDDVVVGCIRNMLNQSLTNIRLLPRIPDLVPKNIDTIHLFHREEIPQ
jgi:hypothetical protein